MSTAKVKAGEPQIAGMPAWYRPPTLQLTKAAEAMAKGDGLQFDSAVPNYKKGIAGGAGPGAIVCQPAAIADATVEAYYKAGYIYTVIASEVIPAWNYVKFAASAQFAKWVGGATPDATNKVFGQFVQRPNALPPQPSSSNPLGSCAVGEVIGVLKFEGQTY